MIALAHLMLFLILLKDIIMMRIHGLHARNSLNSTIILLTLTHFLGVSLEVSDIVAYIESNNANIIYGIDKVNPIPAYSLRIFGSLMIVFATETIMNISLVWMNIVHRSLKLKVMSSNSEKRYSKTIIAIQFIFALIVIILISVNLISFVPLIVVPTTIVICCVYVYATTILNRLLKENAVNRHTSSSISQIAKKDRITTHGLLMKNTSRMISIFGLLFCVFAIAYFYLTGLNSWKVFSPIGGIPIPTIIYNFVMTSVFAFVASATYYIHYTVIDNIKIKKGEIQPLSISVKNSSAISSS
jgi:hypothetical protein